MYDNALKLMIALPNSFHLYMKQSGATVLETSMFVLTDVRVIPPQRILISII